MAPLERLVWCEVEFLDLNTSSEANSIAYLASSWHLPGLPFTDFVLTYRRYVPKYPRYLRQRKEEVGTLGIDFGTGSSFLCQSATSPDII